MDPLASSSRILDPQYVGDRHYQIARQVQTILQRYRELQDIIAILGVDELSEDDKMIVHRARRLERFSLNPSSSPKSSLESLGKSHLWKIHFEASKKSVTGSGTTYLKVHSCTSAPSIRQKNKLRKWQKGNSCLLTVSL